MGTLKNENELSDLMMLRSQVPLTNKIFLTVKEACALSGIAYDTIYEVIARPDVDFVVKAGKKNFIHRVKFEQYLSKITEL